MIIHIEKIFINDLFYVQIIINIYPNDVIKLPFEKLLDFPFYSFYMNMNC